VVDRIEVDDHCRCSKIRLVSESVWQLKITTDDIDDISSVEDNVGHSCESGSVHGLWVPVYSSDAIVNMHSDGNTRDEFCGAVKQLGATAL
jgi:hypothetical protein